MDLVFFFIEGGEAHIEMTLSDNDIDAGDTVHVDYIVWDPSGNDITALADVDMLIEPQEGLIVNGWDVTFYSAGIFQITLSTLYGGDTIEAVDWVWVDGGEVVSVKHIAF